jgi:hypothetical protein
MLRRSFGVDTRLCHYETVRLHALRPKSCSKEELLEMMRTEEASILSSPRAENRRIWIDLHDAPLDDEIITAIVNHIRTIRHKIYRLCFVGCSLRTRQRLLRKMRQEKLDLFNQAKFFSIPKNARQWLIDDARH